MNFLLRAAVSSLVLPGRVRFAIMDFAPARRPDALAAKQSSLLNADLVLEEAI